MASIKQNQQLKLLQKISPQQIQFIKLIQEPTFRLEERIKEEMEINPVLEEGKEEGDFSSDMGEESVNARSKEEPEAAKQVENYETSEREVNIEEYLASESYDYKTQLPSRSDDDDDDYEAPIVQMKSLYDSLYDQFNLLDLTENERIVGDQIIGNIDEDGYFRRPLKAIVSDLAFRQRISVTLEEAQSALRKVQSMDPAGIAAQSLQECLILQLKRKPASKSTDTAIRILTDNFEDFSKKHFSKIRSKLNLTEGMLKEAYLLITKLNPKPGESQSVVKHDYIVPDFIVSNQGNDLEIKLNSKNAPELKVSKRYAALYKEYKEMEKAAKDDAIKETIEFLKNKIDAAQWFIDALKQRGLTLYYTMEAIAKKQHDFFISQGDEKKLKPMILKDIADEIQMDISTISRVANSKYVQTDFGIYPLKYFFTEGIETEGGIVSNREIKSFLEEIINAEQKRNPLSDDDLTDMLNKKGYNIARRTVAKYREQLNIPVARLRKEV